MAAVGGSISKITIRGRIFPVASDSDSNRKLGGVEPEVLSNGDSSARIIRTVIPLSISDLSVSIDDSRGDQEFLSECAELTDFFPIVIEYGSGISYSARAMLTGEYAASSQSATAPVTFMGPGKLTKI